MLKTHLLFALLSIASALFCQNQKNDSPYNLSWRTDAPLLAGGAGLTAGGLFLVNAVEPRTESELAALQFSGVLGLDKDATDNNSQAADHLSDYFLGGSLLLPFTLMADSDIRADAGKIGILLSETALLSNGLTAVAKGAFRRNRPYVFNPDVTLEDKLNVDSRLSFFSGHTSATASLSFFTAKVWSDYHPDSKWKPLVWAAAAAVPAVTGYLRYKAGKHYFSDVATGYAVGALVGILVPHLHKVNTHSKRKLRLSSSMSGATPLFVVKYRM